MSIMLAVALWFQTPEVNRATEAFRAGYEARQRGDLHGADMAFKTVVRLMPNVAAGHTAYGAVLLEEDNLAAAAEQLETAHRLDPADTTAIGELASVYTRQAQYTKSLALLKTLPESARIVSSASIDFSIALAATGDLSGAARQLQSAIRLDPGNPALHDALGSTLAQQQSYEQARVEFQKSIALDGQIALSHLHLGSLYLLEQNLDAAVAEFQVAASLAPTQLDPLLQLGRAQMQMHQDAQAVDTLKRAHALAPGSADATYTLALALQNTGELKESLKLFAQAAPQRSKDAQFLTNYALAYVQSGDAKAAFPLYEQALRFDRDNPVLHEDYGVAHLQAGDFDHALAQFRTALSLVKDDNALNAALHYDIGLALKLKDRSADAVQELLESEHLDPALPDPPYTLGVLYMQLGQFGQASAQLETATRLRPENGEAWSLLGSVYQQMEDYSRAVPALRRAIELRPEQPGSYIVLAGILSRQGDRTGAAAERAKAAKLSRVAIDRQHTDFALKSATALLRTGHVDEAVAQLQIAIGSGAGAASLHRLLAEGFERQGKTAEAATERRRAEQLDTESP